MTHQILEFEKGEQSYILSAPLAIDNNGAGYIYYRFNDNDFRVFKIDNKFKKTRVNFSMAGKRYRGGIIMDKYSYVEYNKGKNIIRLYHYNGKTVSFSSSHKYWSVHPRISSDRRIISCRAGSRIWYWQDGQEPVELMLTEKYQDFKLKAISPDGKKLLLVKENKNGLYTHITVYSDKEYKDLNIQYLGLRSKTYQCSQQIKSKSFNESLNRGMYIKEEKVLMPYFFDKEESIWEFDFKLEILIKKCDTPSKRTVPVLGSYLSLAANSNKIKIGNTIYFNKTIGWQNIWKGLGKATPSWIKGFRINDVNVIGHNFAQNNPTIIFYSCDDNYFIVAQRLPIRTIIKNCYNISTNNRIDAVITFDKESNKVFYNNNYGGMSELRYGITQKEGSVEEDGIVVEKMIFDPVSKRILLITNYGCCTRIFNQKCNTCIVTTEYSDSTGKEELDEPESMAVPIGFSNGCLVGRIVGEKGKHFCCYWEQKKNTWCPVIIEKLKNMTGELCFVSKDKTIFAGNSKCSYAPSKEELSKIYAQAFIYNKKTDQIIKVGSKSNSAPTNSEIFASNNEGTLFCGKYDDKPAIYSYCKGTRAALTITTESKPGWIHGMTSDGSVLYGTLGKNACLWMRNEKGQYNPKTLAALIEEERDLFSLQGKDLKIIKVSDDALKLLIEEQISDSQGIESNNPISEDEIKVSNKVRLITLEEPLCTPVNK